MNNLNSKILKAAKWSTITEIFRKLMLPITNMILARILAPEAFGIVATITMIISFADMFTDAGFQKYIIQYQFEDEEEKNLSINVAFWTNLTISIILWIIVSIFSNQIATMVGNPGLGDVIRISGIQLPITAFSSIQLAIYRRGFDFKSLFLVRTVSTFIPFFVTIPLALLGYSYWSLIIGTICGIIYEAVIMTIKSKWKPSFVFSFKILFKMQSFCIWSLIETIASWLTMWIDTFILGNVLSLFYLGIYKTALSTVNGIFGFVSTTTLPILFSALSRVQDNEDEFKSIFLLFQKIVSYFVLPLSIGMFVYNNIVVKIFLGNSWSEANSVVAVWSLVSGIVIILGSFPNEVYRAKGKPRICFLSQFIYLVFIVLSCWIGSKYDFYTLTQLRAISRLALVIVNLVLMKWILDFNIVGIIRNISIPLISSLLMGGLGIFLKTLNNTLLWNVLSIGICIVVYFILLLCFENSRKDLEKVFKNFYQRIEVNRCN